jgi:hypothetical protein
MSQEYYNTDSIYPSNQMSIQNHDDQYSSSQVTVLPINSSNNHNNRTINIMLVVITLLVIFSIWNLLEINKLNSDNFEIKNELIERQRIFNKQIDFIVKLLSHTHEALSQQITLLLEIKYPEGFFY